MTHRDISRRINQDLDDLQVRDPKKYDEIERRYRRLELDANFYVSQSPPGTRSMERMR